MDDLMPRSAYFSDETGYWHKMPVWAGLSGSILGTLNMWLTMGSVLEPSQVVARGIAGGVLFGVLFWLLFGALMRWTIARAHALPAPRGRAPEDVAYRLVCSFVQSRWNAIPGALYLGRSGAFFVSRREHGVDDPLSLDFPLAELAVASVKGKLNWIGRSMTLRPPTHLALSGAGRSGRFLVPAPSRTIPRVTELVSSLRAQ